MRTVDMMQTRIAKGDLSRPKQTGKGESDRSANPPHKPVNPGQLRNNLQTQTLNVIVHEIRQKWMQHILPLGNYNCWHQKVSIFVLQVCNIGNQILSKTAT